MGSVRHFFASHDQLLLFAVEALVEQARRRIEAGTPARMALLAAGRPLAAVAALLEEVVPLDAERQTEAKVWAAFTTPPATSPEVATIREQVDDVSGSCAATPSMHCNSSVGSMPIVIVVSRSSGSTPYSTVSPST